STAERGDCPRPRTATKVLTMRRVGSFSSCLGGASAISRPVQLLLSQILFLSLLLAGAGRSAAAETSGKAQPRSGPRVTSQLTGSITAREGGRLRLTTHLGNVVIHTRSTGKVEYSVQLEADATQKGAKELLKEFRISARETPDGVIVRGVTGGR